MPVGIVSSDSEGKLLFSNKAFSEITNYPHNAKADTSWMNTIADEDILGFQALWHTMLTEQQSITCQVRLKKVFQAPNSAKDTTAEYNMTVLVNAYPYFDNNGVIKEVTGCFTDISLLKRLEITQERRAEEALERAKLSEQLALRTQEAIASESKFKAMAELTPAGMFYGSPEGEVLWANDTWFEITGHEKGLKESMSFLNIILEEDAGLVMDEWINLTVAQVTRTFEMRLKKIWTDEVTGKSSPTTILVCASQEKNEDGSLKSVFGCLSDISLQKQAQRDALERVALSEQLMFRTQEAAASEKKFKQMAELAPCGMFYISPEGQVIWANTQWYEMMGHGRLPEDHYPMSFVDVMLEDDRPLLLEQWRKLTIEKIEVSFEIQVKKPWINPPGDNSSTGTSWILEMAFPEMNDDGSVKSIMGCTADVSHFKWAESVQMRSRLDAEEAKRQQERFMDITSHEMRNPLSAILQCADAITTSLNDYLNAADKHASLSEEFLQNNLEAAQIITLCSQHQTRIINDVLTMSKLDSKLLLVTPVAVQPSAVVQGVLRMYEGELQSHDIKTRLQYESSYSNFDVDWVFCDPSRVTQVFINILTNAIKFTRSEVKREIMVTLGASLDEPPIGECTEVEWFTTKANGQRNDPTLDSDWGDGETIFLYFAVRDTGRGLTGEEKTRLFHRFSQASPKTHVQYGGSGLGLFISRELTELQGGQIGVASEVGKGSTFAFYIKGKRGTAPAADTTHQNSETALGWSVSSNDKHTALNKRSGHSIDLPAPHKSRHETTDPSYIILLVEDNVVNQKVLGKQLRKSGCTVHIANHGQEALDFLRQTRLWAGNPSGEELDLILMDLEMPVMDGLTCTRKIRDFEQEGLILRHVSIIAVTANARMEQMDTAIAAGMVRTVLCNA